MSPFVGAPFVSLFMDVNGQILRGLAGAQKEWADFFQRRVQEDIAVSQQLMRCQSPADVLDVCSAYLRRTSHEHEEHSSRAARKARAATEELADTDEARARETARAARH
jgi:hypothetical protein